MGVVNGGKSVFLASDAGAFGAQEKIVPNFAELRQAYARFHLGEDKYRMYHGTTLTSALDICEGSFRVGTGGSSGGESTLMLGPGVYASPDRKKAETYAKMRKGEPGAILELEVDMGKKICKVTSQEQHNRMTWQLEGYDSAWVPEGCGMVRREMTEVCVKNPK